MRRVTLMMLFFVTGCAIPRINPPPQVMTDRSWVPPDVVIYGQDLPHGFFRFAVNQAQPEPLGDTRGFLPEALFISPDKSEVYADASGPGTNEPHYIYDTKTGGLRDLGPLMAPFTFEYAISPDWHYLAWSNFREPGEHIVDLHTYTVRMLQLPGGAETGGFLIGPAWAADGSLLLTRRPWTDRNSRWTYWKIDLASGMATQIEAQTANGVGAGTYEENGQPIPLGCGTCGVGRAGNPVALPSGARAYISVVHDLVVKDPDGSLNIVAKHVPAPPLAPGVACDCGPRGKYPFIIDVFDGDILLYGFGQDQSGGPELWVYGVNEHMASPLGVAPIEFVY